MASRQPMISRECTPVVNARYDPGTGDTPVTAIVEALSTAEGIDATELPPLQGHIDTDALNTLFESETGTETVLSFTVDSWRVFVNSDGRICVCDTTQPTELTPVFDN